MPSIDQLRLPLVATPATVKLHVIGRLKPKLSVSSFSLKVAIRDPFAAYSAKGVGGPIPFTINEHKRHIRPSVEEECDACSFVRESGRTLAAIVHGPYC